VTYLWLKFVHLVGVFGFLLAHGASTAVAFKLRKERNRERIVTLLQLSGSTITLFYVSFLVLVVGGVLTAFNAHYWGQRWLWTSIVVLAVATAAMIGMARPFYRKLADKVQYRASGVPQTSDEELDEILTGNRPMWVAGIGFVALGFILYLMVLKPTL